MTDRIHIEDLLLRTIIGISSDERRDRQDVLLNIVLHTDTRPAGDSDDIDDALNYRSITKRIIKLVEGSRFHLVEKLAEEIAVICLADPRVDRAVVRVEKPGALRFARSVGVEVDRAQGDVAAPEHAFISLGSNVDAERNLPQAVRRLAARCRLLAVSSVYETRPVGQIDQPRFLNAAALIATRLSAADLKIQVLQVIEQELGRDRTEDKNAPRTIDLDLSLFGSRVLQLGDRSIPEPEILQYAHIARPLADLAPMYRHPQTGQTLLEIARGLPEDELRHRRDLVLWPGIPVA